MAVYVDDMDAPFRNMVMCHLIADTTEELLEMVDKIKVQRKWIQRPGTCHEHFDICLSKKEQAIDKGAVPITWLQLSCMIRYRFEFGRLCTPGKAERWMRYRIKKRKDQSTS